MSQVFRRRSCGSPRIPDERLREGGGMAQQTWTRKRNDGMGVLSVLLLAAIVGCEGGGGGETPNTLPTFLEGTQSALHVQAQGTVTIRVRAQDAESASLRFSWEASPG